MSRFQSGFNAVQHGKNEQARIVRNAHENAPARALLKSIRALSSSRNACPHDEGVIQKPWQMYFARTGEWKCALMYGVVGV